MMDWFIFFPACTCPSYFSLYPIIIAIPIDKPNIIHARIMPVSLISITSIQAIIATGINKLAVISGSKCAKVFSISSTLSTNIVFNFPLAFLSKYPIGSLTNFSQIAYLKSFKVKYAALWDIKVEIFANITLATLQVIVRMRANILRLSLIPLKIFPAKIPTKA